MKAKLSEVETLSREDLVILWQKNHESKQPKGIGLQLLRLSATYHCQTFGKMKWRNNIEKRLLKRKNITNKQTLIPGIILVRHWHGRTYRVEALAKGVKLDNRLFSSLTAVTEFITGTKQSGPLFFGIKKRNSDGHIISRSVNL